MFCYNCGTKVPDHAKFCQSCGTALNEVRKVQDSNKQPEQQVIPQCDLKEKKQKEDKKDKKGKKSKKTKLILCLAVGVLAVIAVAVWGIYEYLSNRWLEWIPHPESFLEMEAERVHSGEEYNGWCIYTFHFDEDPARAIDGYRELLEDQYSFELEAEENRIDNLHYYYSYSGDKFYFDADMSNIIISNYGNDYYPDDDTYVVEFKYYYQNNFGLLPVYEKDKWKQQVSYEDADEDLYEDMYEEIYEEAYEETYQEYDAPEAEADSYYDGGKAQSEATESEFEEWKEEPAYFDEAVLPDLGLFLGCERDEDKPTLGNARMVSYKFDMDDTGKAAVEEAIDLMEAPGYQLSGWMEEDDFTSTSASLYRSYYYTYMGQAEEISGVEDEMGYFYDVHVLVAYYYDRGSITLNVYYSDDFTLEDPGSRAANRVGSYEGSSDASGSYSSGSHERYVPDHSKKDCSMCSGSGDCDECGGDGYLWSSAADDENRNCWKCNTTGDCGYCNGTGKQK